MKIKVIFANFSENNQIHIKNFQREYNLFLEKKAKLHAFVRVVARPNFDVFPGVQEIVWKQDCK